MSHSPSRPLAAISGLLATAGALSAGELAAGLVASWRSPVESVALTIIDTVPGPVERWAIETLGTADKPVLVVSTIVVVLLVGSLLGLLARRTLLGAAIGVGVLGLVGVAATAAQADLVAGMPSVVTALVGVPLLTVLLRTAAARSAAGSAAGAEADGDDDPSSDPAEDADTPTATPTMRAGAGGRRAFLGLSAGVVAASAAAVTGGLALNARRDEQAEAARLAIAEQIGGEGAGGPGPVGSATERALGVVDDPLPPIPDGADLGIDGLAPFVTPEEDFYRIDTALVVPRIDPATWSLRIHGMVEQEVEHTYDQLLRRPDLFEADITLTCVSNEVGGDLMSSARWTGVPLRTLLEEAGVDPAADQVVGRSTDDWTAGFPVEVAMDGREAMLALLMNGEPLPAERGFPARLIVPGLYGYVSATKWLSDIELTTFADFDQYWVERGWEPQAPIKTQSRIDVPRPLERVPPGEVTIAGVAWAQRRGIQRVEIRVDDGEWNEVELATEVNVDTWRQWRWTWADATPGSHRLTVRATDADGNVQTEERQPPFPDGATGWMTLLVTVSEDA